MLKSQQYINVPEGKTLTANRGTYYWEGPVSVPKAGGWRFEDKFKDGTDWVFSAVREFDKNGNTLAKVIEEDGPEKTPKPKKSKKTAPDKKEVKNVVSDVEISPQERNSSSGTSKKTSSEKD